MRGARPGHSLRGEPAVYSREQHFFAGHVAAGRLHDKVKSFYGWTMRKTGAVRRYHPLLQESKGEQTFVSLLDDQALALDHGRRRGARLRRETLELRLPRVTRR